MIPQVSCCVVFIPDSIFEVDQQTYLACYCPSCGFMKTIDYASNKEVWESEIKQYENGLSEKQSEEFDFWQDF